MKCSSGRCRIEFLSNIERVRSIAVLMMRRSSFRGLRSAFRHRDERTMARRRQWPRSTRERRIAQSRPRITGTIWLFSLHSMIVLLHVNSFWAPFLRLVELKRVAQRQRSGCEPNRSDGTSKVSNAAQKTNANETIECSAERIRANGNRNRESEREKETRRANFFHSFPPRPLSC